MFDKFKNICGIYKITFPNQKSYIGLSSNIQKRMITHNKTHDDLPVHKAIEQYGLKEEYIEILEQFDKEDRELLQEREKYWINKFSTYHNGYNLTEGGDGASSGVLNSSAKLTQESLEKLVKELIDNKIYIKDLSKKYCISARAISDINQGKSYFNKNLSYPLRPDTKFTSEEMKKINGVEKSSSMFNQEQLNQIIEDLKDNKLSLKEISIKFNCCENTITKINNGNHYYQDNIDYPIRKKNKNTSKISEEDLLTIFQLLKETNLPFSQIAKKFNVCNSSISRINQGKINKRDNVDYPIRKK